MIYPYVLEVTKWAVQGVTISFSLFCPSGKAGGAQILRYQGIAVNNDGFTLGALALIPSGFCNDGVYIPAFYPDGVLKNLTLGNYFNCWKKLQPSLIFDFHYHCRCDAPFPE